MESNSRLHVETPRIQIKPYFLVLLKCFWCSGRIGIDHNPGKPPPVPENTFSEEFFSETKPAPHTMMHLHSIPLGLVSVTREICGQTFSSLMKSYRPP